MLRAGAVAGYRRAVVGYRLAVAGYRLAVAGYRLAVVGYRLAVARNCHDGAASRDAVEGEPLQATTSNPCSANHCFRVVKSGMARSTLHARRERGGLMLLDSVGSFFHLFS
jgi:hypothetical protein